MIDPGFAYILGVIWGVFGTLAFRAAFAEHRSLERSKPGGRHPLKDGSSISQDD